MILKRNAKNPNLVEDDFGNPIFEFVGTHPSDLEIILGKDDVIYKLKADINDLEKELLFVEIERNKFKSRVEDLEGLVDKLMDEKCEYAVANSALEIKVEDLRADNQDLEWTIKHLQQQVSTLASLTK